MSLVPSHRATTSSRTPGRLNTGTVWFAAANLVQCEECQGLHLDVVPPGKHSPHWVGGVLVNCREVPL